MQEINKELLIYLNSLGTNNIIENFVLFFIDTPIFFIPIFLLGAWLFYSYKNKNINQKNNLLLIFYSILLAIITSLIIQQIITIQRPETVIEATGKLLLKHLPDASFPSDHATVSFAFLVGLYFSKYKKTFYIFSIFVIFMNLSRVIAGVHWPLDVIAGSLVGIFSSIITFKYLSKNKLVKKLNSFIIQVLSYIKL